MKKQIVIDGKKVWLECNALLPRNYRKEFGRDLLIDMKKLKTDYDENPDIVSTECLENLTWLMMKAAGEEVGDTVEEWLATLDDSFAVYTVISDVVDLWLSSQKTTSKPKKK